jgi:hypothetical protein
LPLIGSLLGHSQVSTIVRYAHLLISVGTAAAQADGVTVTITNAGQLPISINIQDLKDYREDLDGGQTKSVLPENLTEVDPNNNNIQWEARLRDLQTWGRRGRTRSALEALSFFKARPATST